MEVDTVMEGDGDDGHVRVVGEGGRDANEEGLGGLFSFR